MSFEERITMDKVYKKDIPSLIATLEDLHERFMRCDSKSNWRKLRIQPLLRHAKQLERVMQAPEFMHERERLTTGVAMFRSDLVYLRDNVRILRSILDSEEKTRSKRASHSRVLG
jgi:hypothetical protein